MPQELLKNTDESHVDYANLVGAQAKLETVVAVVNENSRQTEGVKNSMAVQTKFFERLNIITPTRKLVREDQMYQVPAGEERKTKSKLIKKEHQRHMFLFNDLFLISRMSKEDKDKLSLVAMTPLDRIWARDLGGDENEGVFRFEIEERPAGTKTVFATTSIEIKAAWVRHIKKHSEARRRDLSSSSSLSGVEDARGDGSTASAAFTVEVDHEILESPGSAKMTSDYVR